MMQLAHVYAPQQSKALMEITAFRRVVCTVMVDRGRHALSDEDVEELSACGHERTEHWNEDGAGMYCRGCYGERFIAIDYVEHEFSDKAAG